MKKIRSECHFNSYKEYSKKAASYRYDAASKERKKKMDINQ